MRGHTREHRTNNFHHEGDADKPISAREFFHDVFGDRPEWAVHLRGFRTREGLSQSKLAEIFGLRQTQISEMERGKRPIGKAFAQQLAEFFHTSYKSFL